MTSTILDEPAVSGGPPDGGPPGHRLAAHGTAVAVGLAWIVVIVATSLHRSDFLSHQTILAVTFTMSIVGVLAVGEALVAISGGILDLSLPTALIFPAYVIEVLLGRGLNSVLVVVAALVCGAAWGALNATIIVFGKLNPIIVTLGTNFAGLAVLFLVFQSAQTPIDSGVRKFGQGYFLGLPDIFWPMVLLVGGVGFFLPRTRYGRRAIAVGGNPQAAKVRGVSLRRTRYAIFMAAGVCGGLAAVLFTGSNPSFTPNDANIYLLSVIAAVILAGISLSGGQGNLWLLLLSVGFLSTVPTALVFFGLSSAWQTVLQGFILILAVSLDGLQRRRDLR